MKNNDKITVLLVEDEDTLAMIIKDTLDDEGFRVIVAGDGGEGLLLYSEHQPDIVISDVMMPVLDGFGLVSRIRRSDLRTPVLLLTARSAIKDVVEGFEAGATDYLRKPFNMQELIVRIKALLGRVRPQNERVSVQTYAVGGYIFTPLTQMLAFGDRREKLSNREAEILKRLCVNVNNVVESRTILLELWGDDGFFNTKSLHVFITKLRRKLAADGNVQILNVRGLGYKLITLS